MRSAAYTSDGGLLEGDLGASVYLVVKMLGGEEWWLWCGLTYVTVEVVSCVWMEASGASEKSRRERDVVRYVDAYLLREEEKKFPCSS
jgi:hypothetical protein